MSRQRRKIDVRPARAGEASKWCPTHNGGEGAYMALSSFWRNNARHDGLQAHCVECQKRYDEENPEQLKKRKRTRDKKLYPLRGYGDRGTSEAVKAFMAGEDVELPVEAEAGKLLAKFLGDGK